MTKVSEEQPRDTFSLFLRLMSIGDWLLKDIRDKAGAAPKEKRKAEPLRARPIPKMRRQRLFLGLSEEIVQFAIDAIHRLNQAIQGAIQRGLNPFRSTRKPDSAPPSSFGFSALVSFELEAAGVAGLVVCAFRLGAECVG